MVAVIGRMGLWRISMNVYHALYAQVTDLEVQSSVPAEMSDAGLSVSG